MNSLELVAALVATRVRKGLTQKEVARRMHYSPSTVWQFENGIGGKTFGALERYATAVGVQLVVTLEEVTEE